MRFVRGRTDARWLPSRFNFALFRLLAYQRLRTARPETGDTILGIDHHQSAFESYSVSVWVVLTLTCYVWALLFSAWPLPVGLAVAFPIAGVGIQIPFYVSGLVLAPAWKSLTRSNPASNIDINSAMLMTMLIAAAAYFAVHPTWVRFVARLFLVAVATNAAAAVVVYFLRNRIDRLEGSFGGATSEL
jgi:hypothetical protein